MIKDIDHIAIYTNDQEKSIKYYKNLGFEIISESPNSSGKGKVYRIKAGNVRIDLLPAEMSAPHGIAHIAFLVENMDKIHKDLRKKGFEFRNEIHFNPRSGRTLLMVGLDPDGVNIQLSTGIKKG